MQINQIRSSAIAALLLTLGISLAGCSGGSTAASPAPTPTASAAPAFTTASCSTSGTTSGTITGGTAASIAGGTTPLTSPVVGGCSYSNNLGSVIVSATAGTYSGSISLTPPTGLPAIPAANTCTTSCGNNGPPTGFATSNFVPLFYLTFNLTGFVGSISQNGLAQTITVNSITSGTNSSNFFIGTFQASAAGSTPPTIAATSFGGWTSNNNQTTFMAVPLTVTLPNTLSIPAYACTPAGTGCANNVLTTATSITLVTVVGYFT